MVLWSFHHSFLEGKNILKMPARVPSPSVSKFTAMINRRKHKEASTSRDYLIIGMYKRGDTTDTVVNTHKSLGWNKHSMQVLKSQTVLLKVNSTSLPIYLPELI